MSSETMTNGVDRDAFGFWVNAQCQRTTHTKRNERHDAWEEYAGSGMGRLSLND